MSAELADVVGELLNAVRAANYEAVRNACVKLRGGRLTSGEPVPGLLVHAAGTRNPATCTTAELDELLEHVRHPGPMWFIEHAPAAEKLLRAVLATGASETPIDEPMWKVLKHLKKVSPRLRVNADIEAATGLSKGTVAAAVNTLVDSGYAVRPAGPRKGTMITPEGKKVLADRP